jgi:hypothetical protein
MTKRIVARGEKTKRPEDSATSVAKQITTFRIQTYPVIEFFEASGKVKNYTRNE